MAKAALLGIGVVGGGVAELLRDNAGEISSGAGEPIELKYILASRPHPESPFSDKIIHDFSLIENDPEVSVVAECIGGVTAAYDYVKRALRARKSVVSSNKELIAEKGLELLSIAKEKNVSLLFEASVGGGIPIIRPLAQCLAANRIEEIYGILNGTTNYILTQMLQCGEDFDSALKQAQRLGYAEADPSADVEGLDACRKICILADMCFGHNVPPERVKTRGITCVTDKDTSLAGQLGFSIKLLGRAVRVGEQLAVYVSPHLIASDKLLSNINGVMNGICVKGNAVGECLFYGAGAGRLPTASAVVADIIDAVRREDQKKYIGWDGGPEELLTDPDELPRRWYIRAQTDESTLFALFGEKTVSSGGQTAAITPVMPLSQLKERTVELSVETIFPVLD